MKRSSLKRIGKKGRQWEAMRAKLKVRFERAGITDCELCGSDWNLSFAHSFPRREITTSQLLEEVALLCCDCHAKTDSHGHKIMHDTITRIIDSRETPV